MEMKKVLSLVVAAGIIAAATTSFADLVNSKHNMRTAPGLTTSAAYTNTQLCVYCHTPHNASAVLPLWNRQVTAGADQFKLYDGSLTGTANQTSFGDGFTEDSPSLFCMSCHDGVTNINATHNGAGLRSATIAVGAKANLGTDLSNDSAKFLGANAANPLITVTHPVNFPVTDTTSQNDLWPVAGGYMSNGVLSLPLFQTSRHADKNSVECSSCHSVHNYENTPFLRYTMAGSALCLGCHNK